MAMGPAVPQELDSRTWAHDCAHCPSGLLAGIHWPAWPDDRPAPDGWSWVEHCARCRRYADDEAAALALSEIGFGTRFQWFDRRTHERQAGRSSGAASLAIDFPGSWRGRGTH